MLALWGDRAREIKLFDENYANNRLLHIERGKEANNRSEESDKSSKIKNKKL